MLSLSRRVNERIVIGEAIILTVVRIQNHQVRLAFEAPRDVAIVREEVAGQDRVGGRERGPGSGASLLVLSRRAGQRVLVAGGIIITVVQVKNQQVRLAFEAPAAVGIFRQELLTGDRPAGCAGAGEPGAATWPCRG